MTPAREQLAILLNLLFGAEPAGAFVEVRYKRNGGGMGQLWLDVGRVLACVDAIRRLGRNTDTYVGVLPRTERRGGCNAIERGHVLYVDCDSAESIAALGRFESPPSLVVGSGGGRHAYWALNPPAGPEAIRRANRRLAHRLGADMASTDPARILRPPATLNHKYDPPRPVEILSLDAEVYSLAHLVSDLPDPPGAAAREHPPRDSSQTDDDLVAALRSIPPPEYVERLTGRLVGADGKAQCRFHSGGQERTPSLHAYPDPDRGWTCFGCEPPPNRSALGGNIFDLAGLLWEIEPRAAGFIEIRDRLATELLGVAA